MNSREFESQEKHWARGSNSARLPEVYHQHQMLQESAPDC